MIIIKRGIPGSGKSFSAARLIKEAESGKQTLTVDVVSTDFYWRGDYDESNPYDYSGEYRFNPLELPSAHSWCLKKFMELLEIRKYDTHSKLIIVDNTNIHLIEASPYVALGQMYDHEVVIHNHYCDPETAYKRNLHGLEFHSILRMHHNFMEETHKIPPWWKSRTFPSGA